jgi:hypothetical protein
VGPTENDARQFAALKGEWVVEGAMADGKELAAEQWKGKSVAFATGTFRSPENSATLSGRLRTKGRMAWLETKTFTFATNDAAKAPVILNDEYCTSFQIDGNKMRLLLIKVTKLGQRGPRPVAESKGEDGILYFLRRR